MRPPVLVAASIVAALACAPKAADTPIDTSAVKQAGAPTDAAAVRSAIDAAEAKWSAAMMKGDTLTMTSIYADDAIFMAPETKRAAGRAAISQMNAGMMKDMTFTGVSLKADDVIVTGDYAIETGTYRMTVHPKTGKAMDDVGKFVSIWQKQADGSWKMIRDIYNTDGAAK